MNNAIALEFKNAWEAFCVQHLRTNVLGRANPDTEVHFMSMAYATNWESYQQSLQHIKATQTPDIYKYIEAIPPNRYARMAMPVSRFGRMSSNTVEAVNGQLVELRQKPIIELLEGIWDKQMGLYVRRRQEAAACHTVSQFPWTPTASAWLIDQQKQSKSFRVNLSEQTTAFIEAKVYNATSSQADGAQCLVYLDIARHTGRCSCLEFQDMLMPCRHAQKVLVSQGLDFRRWASAVKYP